MRISQCRVLLFSAGLCLLSTAARSEDWPRYRGPGGLATSADRQLPTSWNEKQNLLWKTPLPGFGASSPIVVGERIFLTCYSGYGLNAENPGREEDLTRHLLCVRRADGKIAWQVDVPATQPEPSYIDFLTLHGYATSTPTSDGQHVYFFLGKSGVLAYDLDGKQVWRADVGRHIHYWGSAGSPVLIDRMLLVNATLENQSLVALDTETGDVLWRKSGLISSWSTPVVVDLPTGRRELVLSVRSRLIGFDLESGEQLWTCETRQSYGAPGPVVHGDVLFAMASQPSSVLAIRAGGRGDVTDSHVLWRATGLGSGITSPVLYEGRLYVVDDRGIAGAVDADSGKILYQQRLPVDGARFYASPVAADGKVYAVSREQGAFVLAAGPKFELLAHNRLADDASIFNATPAISGGSIFLRSDRFLYCLGRESVR